MKTTKKRIGVLALAATATVALAVPSLALAGGPKTAPKTKYYLPPASTSPAAPGYQSYYYPPVVPRVRLGFYGHFDWRRGMVVDSVVAGSRADRLGLESGDAIAEINGRPIDSEFAYHRALQASGGYGRMIVRDVRTGWNVSLSLRPHAYPGSMPLVQLRTK